MRVASSANTTTSSTVVGRELRWTSRVARRGAPDPAGSPPVSTVLVTGAAGFVGGHLLRALADAPGDRQVVAWWRPSASHATAWPSLDPYPPSVQWTAVDVLDRSAVVGAVADASPDEVYHCAGAADVRGSWTDTATPLAVNVRGTQHLLDAVATVVQDARVLIPGSALIYQPSSQPVAEEHPIGPVSPYAVSKLAQEMLGRQCVETGTRVLVSRSFTHLGPGQSADYAASSFARQIARIEAGLEPPVIQVGSLEAERDLTDVRDTVQAYLALMARGEPGRPYNVCSGRTHTIREVLDGLLHHARVEVTVRTDPARLRPRDNDRLWGSAKRITTEIGWRPAISLDTTLHDLLTYWRTSTSARPS